jgi:muconolactone delta-isomerase
MLAPAMVQVPSASDPERELLRGMLRCISLTPIGGGIVIFVVESHSVSGADRASAQGDEYPLIEQLRTEGFFRDIFVREDGQGAISVVDAPAEQDVHDTLATLPFVKAGVVRIASVVAVTSRW